MQLSMIGLGRMGMNMVRRLLRSGHEVIVWMMLPAGPAVDEHLLGLMEKQPPYEELFDLSFVMKVRVKHG